MTHAVRCLLVGAVAAALAGAPAQAEKADRDKPINVSADTTTLDDVKKVTVLEGNVIITQGTLTIRAAKVVMHKLDDGSQLATAYGNPVGLRQKRDGVNDYVDGAAQRIEYSDRSELVQMFDNARLSRGKDELRNNYIAYNTSTEYAEAKCAPGKDPAQCGRVRATFQPTRKTTPTGTATPPAGTTLTPAQQIKKPPLE
jgi:lipopolysaccharide export system protein LptA